MPASSPDAKCARPGCELTLREHPARRCPGGAGYFLVRRAASQSFRGDEIEALEFITSSLLAGGDPRAIARRPAFQRVARKIGRMRMRIEGMIEGVDDAEEGA